MLAQRTAIGGDDRAARSLLGDAALLQVGAQKRCVIAVGHEADLLAVALGGHRQVHGAGQFADFALGQLAERKHGAGKLLLGEAEQEVSLVLGIVHGAQQLVPAGGFVEVDARVVAGGHLARAHGLGHFQETVELDVVVAQRAGNGRAAGQVLFHERLYYLLLELLLEVHHVVGDADLLGDAAGVVNVVERAAAPRSPLCGQLRQTPLVPKLHGQPHYVVTLAHQERGHGGAVDAAAHGDGNGKLRHVRRFCGGAPPRPRAPPPGRPPARRWCRGPAKNACWRARVPAEGRWR